MKKQLFFTACLVFAFCLFMGATAFSDDVATDPPTEDEASGSRFWDRQLLIDTLNGGQPGEEGAPTDVDPPTDGRVEAFVDLLTDEQVFAFNRALNNAVRSQLYSDIIYDMDLFESLDLETLTPQTINSFTKALEEEAKFLKLYEATGNEKFLEKAASQKEKFLAKAGVEIDDGDAGNDDGTGGDDAGGDDMTSTAGAPLVADAGAAKAAAKLEAKAAKSEAKLAAKTAKMAAKAAAKDEKSAAKAAKKAAKEAAKAAKKESKQNKGKGKGKGKKK